MAKDTFQMSFTGTVSEDVKYTANANGQPDRNVAHMRVWVDDSYNTTPGQTPGVWKNRSYAIRVTAWGKLADKIQNVKKLQRVAVFVKSLGGKFVDTTNANGQTTGYNNGPETYQAQDGTWKASWEVVADDIVPGGTINANAGNGQAQTQSQASTTPPESF